MDKSKVIYVAALLDEESQKLLRHADEKPFRNVYAHHCTLAFGAAVSDYHMSLIGHKFEFILGFVVGDEHAHAVTVRHGAHEFGCLNTFPHITLSTDGVPPKYSNELLQKFYEGCGNILKEMDGVCVRGTIVAFVKTNDGGAEWVM